MNVCRFYFLWSNVRPAAWRSSLCVSVFSAVVGKCSAAEIELKKQQAMERRRHRLQTAQNLRAPTWRADRLLNGDEPAELSDVSLHLPEGETRQTADSRSVSQQNKLLMILCEKTCRPDPTIFLVQRRSRKIELYMCCKMFMLCFYSDFCPVLFFDTSVITETYSTSRSFFWCRRSEWKALCFKFLIVSLRVFKEEVQHWSKFICSLSKSEIRSCQDVISLA